MGNFGCRKGVEKRDIDSNTVDDDLIPANIIEGGSSGVNVSGRSTESHR
jgi:hypothetical protein